MKTLLIETKQGNVKVTKTQNGLTFELPTGMSGKDLETFKKEHSEELKAIAEGNQPEVKKEPLKTVKTRSEEAKKELQNLNGKAEKLTEFYDSKGYKL